MHESSGLESASKIILMFCKIIQIDIRLWKGNPRLDVFQKPSTHWTQQGFQKLSEINIWQLCDLILSVTCASSYCTTVNLTEGLVVHKSCKTALRC